MIKAKFFCFDKKIKSYIKHCLNCLSLSYLEYGEKSIQCYPMKAALEQLA